MSEFSQQLINGISLGSIYALIALGYTMIYGILRFINFAHGDVFMLGAFVGYYAAPTVLNMTGGSLWIAGPIVMALSIGGCALAGVIIEKLAYRPLRSRPRLIVLITAIGVSLFLEFGGQLVFGPDPKLYPAVMPSTVVVDTADLVINSNTLLVVGTSLLLLLLLRYLVLHTKVGLAMRAVSHDHRAAALMGINIDKVISYTFMIGSGLAGAAAVLYASIYPSINPLMGIFPGLKAFVAAVLGGIGNLPGAAVGGFIIGILETFVAGYISSTFRDAIAFGVLILILMFRPSGLFGSSQTEKV